MKKFVQFIIYLAIVVTFIWAIISGASGNEYGSDIVWSFFILYSIFAIVFGKIWTGIPGIVGYSGLSFTATEGWLARLLGFVGLFLLAFLAFYVSDWKPHFHILLVGLLIAAVQVGCFTWIAWDSKGAF